MQETERRARGGILTQKEGARNKYIHACAGIHTHTHPKVDRLTHDMMTTRSWGLHTLNAGL